MAAPAPYLVKAYNTAKESENKIHDDATAAKFGFTGGLVPGVDVYAYMTHQAVAKWGRAWLEHGTLECRFGKPVYDGEIAEIAATEIEGGIGLSVTSQGNSCATGMAALPPAIAAPALSAYPATPVPDHRPPASEASLPQGGRITSRTIDCTPDFVRQYLHDVREAASLYAEQGLVHPGTVLRLCNYALSSNVVLGPWIHVGSKVRNLAPARVGDALTARALITSNHTHKGHKFVVLDALVVANGTTPIAQIEHTAIYLPRQVAVA
jgi:acyl dehydratase